MEKYPGGSKKIGIWEQNEDMLKLSFRFGSFWPLVTANFLFGSVNFRAFDECLRFLDYWALWE